MARSDLRIVIIDDNRDATFTLGMLLKHSGFCVVGQISDPASAVDCIRTTAPHVAIVNIGMPGIDGYQLARQIRDEIQPVPRLVAVTGYCSAKDRHDAISAGFDAHFAKPANWPILEALLLSYVQRQETAPPA